MSNNIIQVYEHQIIDKSKFSNSTYEGLKKFRGDKDNFNFFELTHNGIKFKNYVGVLQVGKTTIEVLPKIDKDNEDDKSKWQKILIGMLKTVNSFDVKHTENASLNIKHNSILELYFEMFLTEVERLLHLGLIKKYRKTEGNLGALKGKLKFNKHITKNIVHKEKFYVEYTTYDADHTLHRIIYKTILLLKKINNNTKLDSKIGNLLLNFPELKEINVDNSTFEKLKFNRKTESYRNAINISRMLLLHYHPDVSNGRNDVLALMFDMNALWEKFVLKTLRKDLVDWSIEGQNQKPFWSGSRDTKLKPDILLTQNGTNNVIIDTKWKQARNEKDLPSNGDLQQLFAYAMYWKCERVALLYPGESIKNVVGNFEFFNKTCNLLFAGGTFKYETNQTNADKKNDIKAMQEDIKYVVEGFLG